MKAYAVSLAVASVLLAAVPASADNYQGVGTLRFTPMKLEPWTKQTFDAHCDDTAKRLCSVVHGHENETYREELLRV